jgi:hypothetical protein
MIEHVDLLLAAVRPRDDEREHDGAALGELADVEDLGASHRAGRPRALGSAAGPRGDVGVGVRAAGGERHRERRQPLPRLGPT